MGLTDLNKKELKELQKFIKLLGVFGITEEDLRYLPQAIKQVKENALPSKIQLTESEKKEIKQKYETKMTPQQWLDTFSGDIEEFTPNVSRKS